MKPYTVGLLVGWVLWLTIFVGAHAVEASETYWPRVLRDADLQDTIGSALLVAAMPVAVGGWLFLWGDGPGQPPEWVNGLPFNVVAGLVLYGALGAKAGAIYGRFRRRGEAATLI